MSILNALSPIHQNAMQKAGFFGTLASIALTFFLHYPFSGYRTTLYVQSTFQAGDSVYSAQCRDVMSRDLKSLTLEDLNPNSGHGKQYKKCVEETNTRNSHSIDLPLWQWASEAAVITWLAPLNHVLTTLALIVVLGAFWLWVFKTKIHKTP